MILDLFRKGIEFSNDIKDVVRRVLNSDENYKSTGQRKHYSCLEYWNAEKVSTSMVQIPLTGF